MEQVSRLLTKIEGMREVLEVRRDVARAKARLLAGGNGSR